MLDLPEPQRDRWLWGAPALSREELRAFDPAGASTEEVVLAAVAAARVGDRRELERLVRAAQARAPDDPTVRTLVLLTGHVRRLRTRLGWPSATDAEVAELRSLAERSALARWTLVAAFLQRRETGGARRALEGCPPEQREAPSVAATEAMIEPSFRVRLRRLRELRARWAPWLSLLVVEARTAHCAGDLEALEEAYRERCALLGRHPWPRLARAWARAPHLGWLAAVAVGVGLALSSPWVFLTAVAVAGAWERLQAHVLDLNRIRYAWLGVAWDGLLAGYWLWAALAGESVVALGVALAVLYLGTFVCLTWGLHRARSREREGVAGPPDPRGPGGELLHADRDPPPDELRVARPVGVVAPDERGGLHRLGHHPRRPLRGPGRRVARPRGRATSAASSGRSRDQPSDGSSAGGSPAPCPRKS